jgi:hypothetical protein
MRSEFRSESRSGDEEDDVEDDNECFNAESVSRKQMPRMTGIEVCIVKIGSIKRVISFDLPVEAALSLSFWAFWIAKLRSFR